MTRQKGKLIGALSSKDVSVSGASDANSITQYFEQLTKQNDDNSRKLELQKSVEISQRKMQENSLE